MVLRSLDLLGLPFPSPLRGLLLGIPTGADGMIML